MSVACFAAQWVRRLGADAGLRSQVLHSLSRGRAYESAERLVVFMVRQLFTRSRSQIDAYSAGQVDISGYSKMAADLTILGKIASELITRSVGAFLNNIIEVITLYRGDIIRFLGDAVLVVFTPEDGADDLGEAVLRATACCLHIASRYGSMGLDMSLAERSQSVVDNAVPVCPATRELKLHFAITAGDVSRIIVGDPQVRLDHCIHGLCIASLSAILDATRQGEMGMSADAFASLDSMTKALILDTHPVESESGAWLFSSTSLQSLGVALLSCEGPGSRTDLDLAEQFYDSWLPETAAASADPGRVDEDFVRLFVDQSMLRRIDAGTVRDNGSGFQIRRRSLSVGTSMTGRVPSEFRSISIVFVSLLFPFSLGKVQAPFTHVNNADQCVRAMCHFMETVEAMLDGWDHKDFAISIATGETLCTRIGNDSRSDPGLLGDVIITSARLMSHSKKFGMLVMDEVTYESVKSSLPTKDLGFVKVKGKENELHIYGLPCVPSTGASITHQREFGYEEERGIIKDRFQEWLTERKRTVLFVEAVSGMGKSCLAKFLIDTAKANGAICCLVQAGGHDRAKAEMTRSVMGFLTKVGVDADLAPLLAMVSPSRLAMDDTPRTKGMDEQAKINVLRGMIVKIVGFLVQTNPVVFVFDDAQWLDSKTLEILVLLSRFCPKGVTLLPETSHMVLKGLSSKDAYDMMLWRFKRATVPVVEIDKSLVEGIYEKTSGNPVFLQMILDSLFVKIGTDIFITDDGKLRVKGDESAVPVLTELSGAVLFQFDRLNATLQQILKAASVLGQYFHLSDVVNIVDLVIDEEEAIEVIKECDLFHFLIRPSDSVSQHTIVTLSDTSSDITLSFDDPRFHYSFRHISIMNAIYESFSFEERIGMNRNVAERLEALLTDHNRQLLLPSIEFHYSRTLEADKIVDYKEELGCSLIRSFQCIEGIQILESLLAYVAELNAQSEFALDLAAASVSVAFVNSASFSRRRPVPTVTPLRRARWLAHLCSGYYVMRRFPKEREVGIEAFELLYGTRWPRCEREVRRALRPLKLRALWLWHVTRKGWRADAKKVGMVDVGKSAVPVASSNVENVDEDAVRLEVAMLVLGTLVECFSLDRSFSAAEMYYVFLQHLVLVIKRADRVTWRLTVTNLGLQRALEAAANEADRGVNHPKYMFTKAATYFFSRDILEGVPLFERFAQFSKTRGDLGNELYVLYGSSIVRLFAGDLMYIVEKPYPVFCSSPLLKEDLIMGFNFSGGMLRWALAKGEEDMVELRKWRGIYEPKALGLAAFPYARGAYPMLMAWWEWSTAGGGQYRGLEWLKACAEKVDIHEVGVTAMDTLATIPIAVCVALDPLRSGCALESPEAWAGEALREFRRAVAELAKKTRAFLRMREYVLCFWSLQLLDAALDVTAGKGPRAAKMLKRRLSSGRKDIEDLKFYKGVYCGLISKYSVGRDDKLMHQNLARKIFTDMGTSLFLRWLDS
ncbi:hypothetical protein HK101_010082 [Irineochytrium annulatum]|nr:hypothetical protein HK101_010082 [Irineochytrium annulatum]